MVHGWLLNSTVVADCWLCKKYSFASANIRASLPASSPARPHMERPSPWFSHAVLKLGTGAQVRLLLAGKDATPSECALHPGRIVCQVERLLSA